MLGQQTMPNGMAMGGYQYQGMPQQPVTKFNNPLNAEQIKKLMQTGEQFTVSITEDQMLRSVCNHRNPEGTGDALVYDQATGVARCQICGYEFKPIDPDVKPEDIKDKILDIIDVLQTIKLMYIDLPPEAAFQYFPIIALLEKAPQLFEFAVKNMAKHESVNWQWNNRNMNAINMLNNLQNMFGAGFSFGGQPQQTMGTGMPNMMGGAMMPMGTPMMGVPNPAGGAGFGYPGANAGMTAQPQQGQFVGGVGYAPGTNGFVFQPGIQQPANTTATEAAPAADAGSTTVTQTVTP